MQLSSIFCIVRCEWTLYDAPTYGMMTPDGEWTEDSLVYDLATGKADMAVGAISIMAERETVVDFTVPYYDLVGVAVVMKKMEAPTNLFNFMIVFENSVWFTIAGAWFVSSVVLWAFDRQESKYKYIITCNFFFYLDILHTVTRTMKNTIKMMMNKDISTSERLSGSAAAPSHHKEEERLLKVLLLGSLLPPGGCSASSSSLSTLPTWLLSSQSPTLRDLSINLRILLFKL